MDEKRLQEVEVKLYTPDLAIVQYAFRRWNRPAR